MERKKLLYFAALSVIVMSLALIFILPNLISPRHLELYDVEDGRNVYGLCKICYLRWHGRKTELKIECMWSGSKWNEIVDDGDTFTLTIPRFTRQCGWVEIRYDHKIIVVQGTGELGEIPWYE